MSRTVSRSTSRLTASSTKRDISPFFPPRVASKVRSAMSVSRDTFKLHRASSPISHLCVYVFKHIYRPACSFSSEGLPVDSIPISAANYLPSLIDSSTQIGRAQVYTQVTNQKIILRHLI